MSISRYTISDIYLARSSGTSDGTQDKYYKDNLWYKIDRYGGEGIAEYTTSQLLHFCQYPDNKYVQYTPCMINGKPGCYSSDFLKKEESFITLYRLYQNTNNKDLSQVCAAMDYDDAINYVIKFVESQTGLDIREYLADTFLLDYIILNEDRHFNNLGIIFDGEGYRAAPIFDNGKSFLIGNKRVQDLDNPTLADRVKCAYAKAFSPSFDINYKYLKKYCSLNISKDIADRLAMLDNINPEMLDIIDYQITRLKADQ